MVDEQAPNIRRQTMRHRAVGDTADDAVDTDAIHERCEDDFYAQLEKVLGRKPLKKKKKIVDDSESSGDDGGGDIVFDTPVVPKEIGGKVVDDEYRPREPVALFRAVLGKDEYLERIQALLLCLLSMWTDLPFTKQTPYA